MKKYLLPFLIGLGLISATVVYAVVASPNVGGAGIGSATSGQVGYNLQVSTTSPFLGYVLAPISTSSGSQWTTTSTGIYYNGGAGQTMCNGTGGPLCSTPRHKIIIISFKAKPEHFQFA